MSLRRSVAQADHQHHASSSSRHLGVICTISRRYLNTPAISHTHTHTHTHTHFPIHRGQCAPSPPEWPCTQSGLHGTLGGSTLSSCTLLAMGFFLEAAHRVPARCSQCEWGDGRHLCRQRALFVLLGGFSWRQHIEFLHVARNVSGEMEGTCAAKVLCFPV
eukprot:1158994-Pelagomonas_calceolata.AAC.1